jgi:hypothetical protein
MTKPKDREATALTRRKRTVTKRSLSKQDRLQTEREESRLEALETASRGQPKDWLDRFAPGSFGCHELLDRLSMVSGILTEYVLNHPACLANPEWYAEADTAVTTLCSLYQKVGRDH